MKQMYLTVVGILLAVLPMSAPAQGLTPPQIIELMSDKVAYESGEMAVLTVELKVVPSDPEMEFVLESQLNAEALTLTKISERQYAVITAPLSQTGSLPWQVRVYQRYRDDGRAYEEAQAFYESEIIRIDALLAVTTDPATIALLQAEKTRDEALLQMITAQIASMRRLITEANYTIEVSAISQKPKINQTAAFDVTPDQSAYTVGQTAHITVQINTDWTGEEGPQETLVRALFGGQPEGLIKINDQRFESAIGPFVADQVGTTVYKASVLIRSQPRANYMRAAIAEASNRRGSLIAARDNSQDPMTRAYYDREITRASRVIDQLYAALEHILVLVGESELPITVNPV